MAEPIDELNARLDEITLEADFIKNAVALYPRIAAVINRGADANAVGLATKFQGSRLDSPDGIFSGLYLRVLASQERFGRLLIISLVEKISSKAKTYEQVDEVVRNRNTINTGRLLTYLETPRDYAEQDYPKLIANLASCTDGNQDFKLNANCFADPLVNGKPESWDKTFGYIGQRTWADLVGATATIKKLMETKNTREANALLRKHLNKLWTDRNQIAHAGDAERRITYEELINAIEFVRELSRAMSEEIIKKI